MALNVSKLKLCITLYVTFRKSQNNLIEIQRFSPCIINSNEITQKSLVDCKLTLTIKSCDEIIAGIKRNSSSFKKYLQNVVLMFNKYIDLEMN